MTIKEEEAIFDQVLQLLGAQRQLLQEKLSSEDHARFTQQSQEIQDLLARLTRGESASPR